MVDGAGRLAGVANGTAIELDELQPTVNGLTPVKRKHRAVTASAGMESIALRVFLWVLFVGMILVALITFSGMVWVIAKIWQGM